MVEVARFSHAWRSASWSSLSHVVEPSSREAISDSITSSAVAECWPSCAFSMPCGVAGFVLSIGVPGSEEIGSGEGTGSSGIRKPSASSLRGLSRNVCGVTATLGGTLGGVSGGRWERHLYLQEQRQ